MEEEEELGGLQILKLNTNDILGSPDGGLVSHLHQRNLPVLTANKLHWES